MSAHPANAHADDHIAIAATFTAETLQDTLEFWTRELKLDLKVRFAPYNQVFQQLLDPTGVFACNRNGVNVVLFRFEDWIRFQEGTPGVAGAIEENLNHLISLVRTAAASFSAPFVVCLCPPSPAFALAAGRAELIANLEKTFISSLRGLGAVHIVTPVELDDLYPVPNYYDPHGDELGHIPYTALFFTALGTMIARRIQAIRRTPHKVVALDCDDTLWNGICGEDGPESVVIDPPRRALQDFMLAQREAGMLLCLCSKNNEEDVAETFRVHPEMPLRLDHFSARRVNWEAKSVNLAALAAELDLGLDSFIFVDDNPQERAEVMADRPEVLTLPLPGEPADIPRFLKHVWAFDHLRITEEDRRRSALYAQRAERALLARQASTLEEFIASLQLEIRIAPMAPAQVPRVSQLTQRTNQMNLTGIRRSESEIRALVESGKAECLTVDVSDRFGGYGLTGVVIFTAGPGALAVDTFLLSCRVLGRGIEHRILSRLGEIASERGLGEVTFPYVATQRNCPALRFIESVDGKFKETSNGQVVFRFPAKYAKDVVYKPAGPPLATPVPAAAVPVPQAAEQVDYGKIALELWDPARIMERIAAEKPMGGMSVTAEAPRSDLERRLAELWASLLRVPSVGIHDNFFDLGGHSLLVVQLLSRLREEFQVDLSLEIVYGTAFTVAELAKAVELAQIEQAGADQYASILAELEGLSDNEVRALLDKERETSRKEESR
ncbi:MAG: HAD-IIIC family phosphatase [Bryobacteraceae bacterium]